MSDNLKGLLLLVAIIIFLMWAFNLGPFEKKVYEPSFTGGKYKCGASGCDCKIKREELEAVGWIRCSCGHPTTYHHN